MEGENIEHQKRIYLKFDTSFWSSPPWNGLLLVEEPNSLKGSETRVALYTSICVSLFALCKMVELSGIIFVFFLFSSSPLVLWYVCLKIFLPPGLNGFWLTQHLFTEPHFLEMGSNKEGCLVFFVGRRTVDKSILKMMRCKGEIRMNWRWILTTEISEAWSD